MVTELPQTADDFLTRWVDASNRGDWETFAAMLHEDVVIEDPQAEPAVGRPAALDLARAQFAPFPDGHVTVLAHPMTRPGTDVMAYHWRFTGTHTAPIDPPGFAPTAAHVELQGVSLITVEAGRARSVRLFYDSAAVARQIGAAPRRGSLMERGVVAAQRVRARLGRPRQARPDG